jgi:hypothetical protein
MVAEVARGLLIRQFLVEHGFFHGRSFKFIRTQIFTARHSRNQKNKFFLEQKQSQKSPLPPFIKGGLGGI